MRVTIRSLRIPRQTPGTLAEIARQINPLLRGWIGYYGRFSRSALAPLVDYVNQKLKAWIMRKYKRFRFHKTRASLFLRKIPPTWGKPRLSTSDRRAVGDGPLARVINAASADTGLSRTKLTVMSKQTDPFRLDTGDWHIDGQWFTETSWHSSANQAWYIYAAFTTGAGKGSAPRQEGVKPCRGAFLC